MTTLYRGGVRPWTTTPEYLAAVEASLARRKALVPKVGEFARALGQLEKDYGLSIGWSDNGITVAPIDCLADEIYLAADWSVVEPR